MSTETKGKEWADKAMEVPMGADAQMKLIGELNGTRWWFADEKFLEPGIYYFDGTNNINILKENAELRTENKQLLAHIESRTKGVIELAAERDEARDMLEKVCEAHYGKDYAELGRLITDAQKLLKDSGGE